MENNRNGFWNRNLVIILICVLLLLLGICIAGLFLNNDRSNGAMSYSDDNRNLNYVHEQVSENSNNNYMNESTENMTKSCKYQLIAEDGIISVYSIDTEGVRSFFCNTEIPYELLSESDKIMMRKGIILDTMEDLNTILQDFDS